MNKVKIFFWYCSGADIQLLRQCPTDSSKYAGIGATIFFTGVFAALSGGYALFTVFDNVWIAISLGIVWGLMIFNLDRYIVSSMRKRGKFLSELAIATPRIVLALLISVVIARPLELRIFEKEILAELTVMEQEIYSRQEQELQNRYTDPRTRLRSEIEHLQRAIEAKTVKRDELARIAREEADGTGGTGQRNAGPIYRIKKADADRVASELGQLKERNEALIANKLAALNDLEVMMNNEQGAFEREKIDGPAARMEALSRLTKSSSAINMASFFIILLFIAIETAPIFVKLISSRGPYDYLLETAEYRFETDALKDRSHIHTEIKKRSEKLGGTEKDYVTEMLDMKLNGT
ncbi:DUF4407 domain-containing protein [Fulvivirga sp. M361]|uniref:DUF4407 domain-containing protein n=1 Tax=Fulvivirga sp. M361 TaxID=2594266 RepID=UPI00117A3746|nr:DUF4407 domain-containing protein [Fulvivirga sp. M361]TRX51993.1 DUF4407 domain-containing protein [Fulvivirga sp. M361]